MIPFSWLEQGYERILPYIRKTPLTYDPQHNLYLKWENQQVTGSFKARGAFNKILSLQEWELKLGLVTASAGNHGQGVALAGRMRHAQVTVFASDHAVPEKIQSMRNLGAEVCLVPGGYGEAEQAGISFAKSNGAIWISPYNDGTIIAGQGSVGLEVVQELPERAAYTWLVPAGGGGLVCGIGAVLEAIRPQHRLIAVQSEASPFLHAIYHQGSQEGVVEQPSLADGLAGPVETGSLTIPMVQDCVDDFILVSEDEIRQAMGFAWQHYQERIEGSAAVSLAAALAGKITDRPAVIVLTGGNVNQADFNQIVAGKKP